MIPFQCATCRHYIKGSENQCAAFPKGIPLKILQGLVIHDKPMEGQKNKLVWTREPL